MIILFIIIDKKPKKQFYSYQTFCRYIRGPHQTIRCIYIILYLFSIHKDRVIRIPEIASGTRRIGYAHIKIVITHRTICVHNTTTPGQQWADKTHIYTLRIYYHCAIWQRTTTTKTTVLADAYVGISPISS